MSDTMRGILAMIASMFAFNMGDTLMKVAGTTMPIGEMLFLRGLVSSALIVGYAAAIGAFADTRKVLTWPVFWRTAADSACSVLFFLGLVRISFADASAIGQFIPLMVMAGAAIFLGEAVGWRRWSAAAVGLLGVLMIIKPGTGAFQTASLLIVLSMACVAARDLITRRIPLNVPTVLITVTAALCVTATGAVMSLFETWHWPSTGEIGLLATCGCTVLAGYVFIIIATRHGDTAVVSPFRYTYIGFAMLSSLLVFRERPDIWSWCGIALIVSSGLYMIHRERVVGRRKSQPTAAALTEAA
jgi:drug/metabolite transporter (DMT)-like permease